MPGTDSPWTLRLSAQLTSLKPEPMAISNIGKEIHARIHYNSVTQVLDIAVMPTQIHDCHQDWMLEEAVNVQESAEMVAWIMNDQNRPNMALTGDSHLLIKEKDILIHIPTIQLWTLTLQLASKFSTISL
ncbi:hypothetical protein VTN77DRAFT_9888 [Rasamsonia byssochlamydoides]|uniref:uncharacterized protein n=1 Tax=Rasamsonia byssochlamydoides TaxID=89139 RepID=UPI00374461B3